MSIHQGRVGLRGRAPDLEQPAALSCPSIRAASASAAARPRWRMSWASRVHPSGPRRPPRRVRSFTRSKIIDIVSIHQGRVGLRGALHRGQSSHDGGVSIHQGRVGLRGWQRPGRNRTWTSSVHPSGPRRPPRPAATSSSRSRRPGVHPSGPRRPPRRSAGGRLQGDGPVSIHQGRVGLRGGHVLRAADGARAGVHPSGPRRPPRRIPARLKNATAAQCPSIRAASASAARHRAPTPREAEVSIHQGRVGLRGTRRDAPPTHRHDVSIHQGRVGLRGLKSKSCSPAPAGVHPSRARRPPRPMSCHGAGCGVHPSGGASASQPVAIGQHHARRTNCPSIRAASAFHFNNAANRSSRRVSIRSGPRRPPRPTAGHKVAEFVSIRFRARRPPRPDLPLRPQATPRILFIHQGRVGLRISRWSCRINS